MTVKTIKTHLKAKTKRLKEKNTKDMKSVNQL